ncbi:MAG: hypothetical protein HYY93_06490 [Planctomycetes bacterium]|nr:hypothetical protein [Planctomycetota bacterium]
MRPSQLARAPQKYGITKRVIHVAGTKVVLLVLQVRENLQSDTISAFVVVGEDQGSHLH